MSGLEKLRKQIDLIDKQLLLLLSKRMRLSLAVARHKKKNTLPTLDKKRWAEVIMTRKIRGSLLGLTEKFVVTLFELIHRESLKTQRRIVR